MAPLDPRHTQFGFNLISIQVCEPNLFFVPVHHSNRHLPGVPVSTPNLPASVAAPTDTNIYQAGYQQVDSPDYSAGSDRHSVDLREDPSSYPPPPPAPLGGSPAEPAGPRQESFTFVHRNLWFTLEQK